MNGRSIIGVEQNVIGFDVTMYESRIVDVFQGWELQDHCMSTAQELDKIWHTIWSVICSADLRSNLPCSLRTSLRLGPSNSIAIYSKCASWPKAKIMGIEGCPAKRCSIFASCSKVVHLLVVRHEIFSEPQHIQWCIHMHSTLNPDKSLAQSISSCPLTHKSTFPNLTPLPESEYTTCWC